MNLKERLTKQYEAERIAGLAAVEADYRKKMDALEVVWRSIQKESTPSASSPSVTVARQPEAARSPRVRRLMGVTQAVDEVTAVIEGPFTPEDVHAKVAAKFPDRDVKRQSITDSLWRLEQDKKIRVIVRGRGKRKGEYERIKNANGSVNEGVSHHQELTM